MKMRFQIVLLIPALYGFITRKLGYISLGF